MIEVKNVSKFFNRGKRNQIKAIDGTSLSFPEKGMVAILGNSGCGKTTLLNVIGGLDKPSRGKIYVNGKRMNSLFSGKTDNIRNANIGYIFQNYHLMDTMTVFDNVALVLKMVGIRNKEEVKNSVYYVLKRVGLYKYRNRPVDTLSGGERQRVGIARAIVKNPGIVIADEPTGNLDSRNSLEVMNIIKAISRDKLVILVTHEKDLANFFADRIIEVVDGKVVNDRVNEHNGTLDYRIDNKIYLQDMAERQELTAPHLKVDYVSDGSTSMDVRLVIKGGNLYVQCEGRKIDIVDSSSAIELVDDHYHELTKEEAEKYAFDFTQISHKKKLRYHSIFNPFTALWSGFKTIFKFPVLKKILLLGFMVASGFVMYAYSSYFGITNITDDEFIQVNKNYVTVRNRNNTVEDFQSYAQMKGVNYAIPGDSMVYFTMNFNDTYYQISQATISVAGSLSSIKQITQEDLVYGRMPQTPEELVVDQLIFTKLIDQKDCVMLGLPEVKDFLNRKIQLSDTKEYTIVGISDMVAPNIYTEEAHFTEILMANGGGFGYGFDPGIDFEKYGESSLDDDNNADIADIADAQGELKITLGRMPEADYEVILQDAERYQHRLNSTLNSKVNGQKLTIVGFYKSTEPRETRQFTNFQTVYYKWLSTTSGITLCCEDCDAVYQELTDRNLNVTYNYREDKQVYEENMQDTVETTVIVAAVIFAIALIEIYLILRSSFLSRIKEVGTLRAIGVKKKDIYRQFHGEVLAITLLTATPAFLIVGRLMKALANEQFFEDLYVFDTRVVILSVVTILLFNSIAGLLPVYFTLRKTPAAILARTDVD